MGSHHHWVVAPINDDCFDLRTIKMNFYFSRPVLPSRSEGSFTCYGVSISIWLYLQYPRQTEIRLVARDEAVV